MTDSWIVALYAIGTAFLILEILLPGAIVGTIGTILLLIATYYGSQAWGMPASIGLFLAAIAFCGLLFYLFLRSPLRRWIFLEESLGKQQDGLQIVLGAKGVSLTVLRPSGKAGFALSGRERHLDVLTEGDFIEKDQAVKVIRIDGSKVIVARDV